MKFDQRHIIRQKNISKSKSRTSFIKEGNTRIIVYRMKYYPLYFKQILRKDSENKTNIKNRLSWLKIDFSYEPTYE